MSHRTTFDLASRATTVPPPSQPDAAPAHVDAPADARPRTASRLRRGLLGSSRLRDTTGTGLRKRERRLGALVLIAAPLAGLAGALLTQDYGGELRRELEYIAAHDTRWVIANYLTLLMGALMAIAIGILMTLARGRATGLAYSGGALAIVGIYFHGAVVGYSLVQAPLVGSGLPKAAVQTFAEQGMYQHAAFSAILIPFLGFFLGMILLAVALWRARVAPAWVAAIIGAAPLTEFVGITVVSPDLMFVLFAIGFGHIASGLVRGGKESTTTPVAGGGTPNPVTRLADR